MQVVRRLGWLQLWPALRPQLSRDWEDLPGNLSRDSAHALLGQQDAPDGSGEQGALAAGPALVPQGTSPEGGPCQPLLGNPGALRRGSELVR